MENYYVRKIIRFLFFLFLFLIIIAFSSLFSLITYQLFDRHACRDLFLRASILLVSRRLRYIILSLHAQNTMHRVQYKANPHAIVRWFINLLPGYFNLILLLLSLDGKSYHSRVLRSICTHAYTHGVSNFKRVVN